MSRKMVNLLNQLYSPMSYMKKRYPKAAKKKRIIKKWAKRFGTDDFEIAKIVYSRNPILELSYGNYTGGFELKLKDLYKDSDPPELTFQKHPIQPHLPHE